MQNSLKSLEPLFFNILPVLFAVLLGYRLGLLTYFKQNEHERIICRYLEQGIDIVAKGVDDALGTFKENWILGSNMLLEFQSSNYIGINMREETLNKNFTKNYFQWVHRTPQYKIYTLVGSKIFDDFIQLLYAFNSISYTYFENDLKIGLNLFFDKNYNHRVDPKELHKQYNDKLRDLDKFMNRFFVILKGLQTLSQILETKTLTFKDLENFKNKPEVKAIIKELENKFADTQASLDLILPNPKEQKVTD